MQLTFTAPFTIVTTAGEKRNKFCRKHEFLSLHDVVFFISLIVRLKSNYLTRTNHNCTSVQCIFNWNASVTGYKQGAVGFPQRKPLSRSTTNTSHYMYSEFFFYLRFFIFINKCRCTRWRSWLRHYSTSRKVAGWIPDGVIGFFFIDIILPAALWPWGPTQPPTEISTRNISCGGKFGRCVGLTTLPASCADCLEIWEPQPPGTLRACPGL
jgi:hypothetical protein